MLKKENAPTRQQRIKGFHRAKMELLAKLRADPFLDGGDYRMLDALLEKFLNDDTHECMPSDAKLAEACACHERTIRRRTKKRVLINRQPNANLDAPPNFRYWG